MKLSLYLCLGIMIVALLATNITAAEENWTTRIKDWFSSKNNKIRFEPSQLNEKTRLTLTFANDDTDITIDGADKLHLFFPGWWITPQQTSTPISCSWALDKDKEHSVTTQWTPIDSATPDQGPFLTLLPTQSFLFPKNANLHILCNDVWTPQTRPSDERVDELRRQAKDSLGDLKHNNEVSQDFGLVLINDSASDAAIDRKLSLDSDLKRVDSNSTWLMTISTPDEIKHGRTKDNRMKRKYHDAVCAYVERFAHIKECKVREESFAKDASVFMYMLKEPKVFTIDELHSRFNESPARMQGFKKFLTDLFQLKSAPNIGLNQSGLADEKK